MSNESPASAAGDTTTVPVTKSSTPPPRMVTLPYSPNSTNYHFTAHSGGAISDDLLLKCSQLFGENYGVWGQHPASFTHAPPPGARVKMSVRMMRKQLLSSPENSCLVVCFRNEELVGHAFATVWDYQGGKVCWITQLVVSLARRKRYLATIIIQTLRDQSVFRDVSTVGLVSSHPAACHALAKWSNLKIDDINLDFVRQQAPAVLMASPVEYVRSMKLRGSLFEENAASGTVCSALTDFYVDHEEPLEALAIRQSKGTWPLGDLLEGHEFLVLIDVQ